MNNTDKDYKKDANLPSIKELAEKVDEIGRKLYKRYYNQQLTFPEDVCNYIAEYIYNELILPDFEHNHKNGKYWSENGYCYLNVTENFVMQGIFSYIELKN